MKKYLGLVKIYNEGMSGVTIKILSKTYDDIDTMNKWFNLYPNSEHVLLMNTNELDLMFEDFRDRTPITDEEKEFIKKGKQLLKRLMADD